jgi:hypothetical protein
LNAIDPDEELRRFLGEDANLDEFWLRAKTNLQAGKIRILFVADVIPRELRRIVEFLNEQMDPAEVLAVEIKQFVGQGMKTLVPRVIGQTAEAEKKKGTPRDSRIWDEASFFADYERRHSPEVLEACRKLYDLMNARSTKPGFGRGNIDGSFIPYFDDERGRQQIFNLTTNGKVALTFGWMRVPPYSEEAKRRELLSRFNEVPGVDLPIDSFNRYPNFDLIEVVKAHGLQELLDVVDWSIRQIEDTRTT